MAYTRDIHFRRKPATIEERPRESKESGEEEISKKSEE